MPVTTSSPSSLRNAVRGVAVFEAFKGVLALLGLMGLLSLLHHDVHRLAVEAMDHLGLSSHRGVASTVLHAVDRVNATPVHTLVLVGSIYIAARWLEAWGMWNDKAWGEWLGVASSALYLPLEVIHLWHSPHWQGAVVLLVNLGLVAVLILRLRQRRSH